MSQISGLGAGLNGITEARTGKVDTAAQADKLKGGNVQTGTVLGKGDQASLSVAGGLAAQAQPDVRMDKVQALQAAIASGTYHVSASDVAGKMVDSLLGS